MSEDEDNSRHRCHTRKDPWRAFDWRETSLDGVTYAIAMWLLTFFATFLMTGPFFSFFFCLWLTLSKCRSKRERRGKERKREREEEDRGRDPFYDSALQRGVRDETRKRRSERLMTRLQINRCTDVHGCEFLRCEGGLDVEREREKGRERERARKR